MELYDNKGRKIIRVEQEDEANLLHTPKQETAENLRHLPYGSDYVGPTYYPFKVDNQGRIYVVTDTNADIETDATPTLGGDLDANDKKISKLLSLDFSDFSEVTLNGGVIAVTQSCHTVDTEGDGASDDLDTINGGTNGMAVFIRPENDGRTVVVKHNTGNIWLKGGADLELDDIRDCLMLVYDGTKWMDVGAGGGGGGAPDAHKDTHDPQDGADPLDTAAPSELAGVQAAGVGTSHSLARADHAHQIQESMADNHIVTVNDADAAEDDYLKFTATGGVAGRSYTEVRTDINVADGADVTGDNDPKAHAASHTDGTDDIQDATAAQKGLATAAQITKLDGIDAGADVTGDNAPQAHGSTHDAGGSDQIHSIADDDDDTKIQVEEGADEDKIRMDVAGVEAFRLSAVGILTLAKQSAARAYRSGSDQTIQNNKNLTLFLNGESYDIQNEFDCSSKSGTADATEANKLHDADGGFSAADVGKTVWNTTDNTYTTVSAFVDAGELTLADDIMVNGEGYTMYFARFTATEAGYYQISVTIAYLAVADGQWFDITVAKNGAGCSLTRASTGSACNPAHTVTDIQYLDASDYIEAWTYHNMGSAQTVRNSEARTFMSVAKIA